MFLTLDISWYQQKRYKYVFSNDPFLVGGGSVRWPSNRSLRRSSVEAELHAATLGASESTRVVRMWCDLGYVMKTVLTTMCLRVYAVKHVTTTQFHGRTG